MSTDDRDTKPASPTMPAPDRSEPPPGYFVDGRSAPFGAFAETPQGEANHGEHETREGAVAACWSHFERITAPAEARGRAAMEQAADAERRAFEAQQEKADAVELAERAEARARRAEQERDYALAHPEQANADFEAMVQQRNAARQAGHEEGYRALATEVRHYLDTNPSHPARAIAAIAALVGPAPTPKGPEPQAITTNGDDDAAGSNVGARPGQDAPGRDDRRRKAVLRGEVERCRPPRVSEPRGVVVEGAVLQEVQAEGAGAHEVEAAPKGGTSEPFDVLHEAAVEYAETFEAWDAKDAPTDDEDQALAAAGLRLRAAAEHVVRRPDAEPPAAPLPEPDSPMVARARARTALRWLRRYVEGTSTDGWGEQARASFEAVEHALVDPAAAAPQGAGLPEMHASRLDGGGVQVVIGSVTIAVSPGGSVYYATDDEPSQTGMLLAAPSAPQGGPTWAADIAAERHAQDAQWGGPDHDNEHGPADWLDYINKQVAKARAAQRLDESRERFVKVAALAVAAVETIDRWNTAGSRCRCGHGRAMHGLDDAGPCITEGCACSGFAPEPPAASPPQGERPSAYETTVLTCDGETGTDEVFDCSIETINAECLALSGGAPNCPAPTPKAP